MSKDLVYLVTGAASGLGKATAELLVSEGAKVAFVDVLDYEDNDFLKRHSDQIILLKADVTSEKDIQEVIYSIKAKFGKLNVVVNCAGIAFVHEVYNFEKNEPFPLKEFTKIIEVNTIGTFNVIRLSIELMSQSEPYNENGERGVIINTSSVNAFDGPGGRAAYAASKAALVGMTMPLARDLADQGIRVVTVAPGAFDTPLFGTHHPHIKREISRGINLFPKRLGQPEEFAIFVKVVIETPMLNATTIRLDAGRRIGNLEPTRKPEK